LSGNPLCIFIDLVEDNYGVIDGEGQDRQQTNDDCRGYFQTKQRVQASDDNAVSNQRQDGSKCHGALQAESNICRRNNQEHNHRDDHAFGNS
jgi:hypothetical protein